MRRIDAALRNRGCARKLAARFGVPEEMVRGVWRRDNKMYREVLDGEAPRFFVVEPPKEAQPTLHWLAGYLEGEGSFGVERKKSSTYARISTEAVDEDVVARVACLIGVGYHAKAPRTPAARPTFQCIATRERAAQLMRLLAPLLSTRRRRQVEAALSGHRDPAAGMP